MSKQLQNHAASRAETFTSMAGAIGASLSLRAALLAAVAVAILAIQASAAPVAYWRFGDDASDPNFGLIEDGDWLQPTSGRTQIDPPVGTHPEYIPGYDSTGNGNTLYGWDAGGAGHNYRAHVSSSTVGGGANEWSIQNEGGYPAAFTWSQQSSPTGTDLQTMTPSAWTIEATIKPTTVGGGYRTFVGREGNDVLTIDPNSAPLYFQITDEFNGTQFRINYTDAAGNLHLATSTGIDVIAHQWYHMAATSDGSTLSLYVDQFDGTGYQLAATADLTASANSAMVDPGVDANGDSWGWTVGRGRYGTSDDPLADHGDRFLGNVDEVRISDNALASGSFLFAGQNLNHGPRLEVDRDTGEFTLTNLQASIDLVGYSITSAGEALQPTSWYSVADNQDAGNGGGFDPDNTWNVVASTNSELAETELVGDGGALGSVYLGQPNAWTRSRYEDLQMTIDQLNDDYSVSTYTIPVVFTGGLGTAAERSDFNLDGDVDADDWAIFTTNHLTDLSGLSLAAASTLGDIDGDRDNDFDDFRLFQGDYDAVNGLGAFAAMVAAVPEPSALLLLAVGCIPFTRRRR